LFKKEQLDKIAAKKEGWSAKLEATVKKRPEREAEFARCNAGDNLGAISEHLLCMEKTLVAGYALDNNIGIFINRDWLRKKQDPYSGTDLAFFSTSTRGG